MNNSITVSVCMVTYNQEAYIEHAIKGVLMQKSCDFELIIADDCSTDGTLAICKKYQEQHPDVIHIIEQPQNKGVVGNTKDCLMACSGKYIAICEGDDYWIDDHKLQKQVAILDTYQDVSMVHTSWNNIIQSTGEIRERLLTEEDSICVRQGGKDSVIEIMSGHYYGMRLSSICFRNDILRHAMNKDSELFSSTFSTCDIGLFYIMAYHGRLFRMVDVTTVYRMQDESVSITKDKDKAAKYSLGCLYIKVHYIKEFGIEKDKAQQILLHVFHSLYKYVSQRHDKQMLADIQRLAKNVGYKPSFGQRIRALLT